MFYRFVDVIKFRKMTKLLSILLVLSVTNVGFVSVVQSQSPYANHDNHQGYNRLPLPYNQQQSYGGQSEPGRVEQLDPNAVVPEPDPVQRPHVVQPTYVKTGIKPVMSRNPQPYPADSYPNDPQPISIPSGRTSPCGAQLPIYPGHIQPPFPVPMGPTFPLNVPGGPMNFPISIFPQQPTPCSQPSPMGPNFPIPISPYQSTPCSQPPPMGPNFPIPISPNQPTPNSQPPIIQPSCLGCPMVQTPSGGAAPSFPNYPVNY